MIFDLYVTLCVPIIQSMRINKLYISDTSAIENYVGKGILILTKILHTAKTFCVWDY